MASETCSIQGNGKSVISCLQGCSTSDRYVSIQFPNGRTIGILGHNHGNREKNFHHFNALTSAYHDSQNLRLKLQQAHVEMSPSIQDNRSDLNFLANKFVKDPSFSFIASESESIGYPVLRDSYRPAFEYLRGRSKQGDVSAQKLEEVLMVATSIPVYVDLSRPDWSRSINIKGFESRNLIDAEYSADEAVNRTWDKISTQFAQSPKTIDLIISTRGQIRGLRMMDKFPDLAMEEKIINKVRASSEFAPNPTLVAEHLQAVLASGRASLNRDVHVAEKLSAEGESGIIVIGHSHLVSLARLVRENCLKEANKGLNENQ